MPFFKKWHFLLALAGVASLQQYTTYCHIGITFDSPHYTTAAQSFAENRIFLDPNGNTYTNWTPLFPILLSAFPQNVAVWAKYMHLFTALGSTILLLLMIDKLIDNQILKWIFAGTIIFGAPLLLVHSFLWSESVFIFLFCQLLYFLLHYIEKPTHKSLIIMALLSNLLYLQRNAGLFFIVGIGIFIFFNAFFTSKSIKYALKKSLYYFVPSILSFVFWQIRNYFFVVNLSDFKDNVFVVSGLESLLYMLDIISLWLLPNVLPLVLRLFLMGILAGIIIFLVFKAQKNNALQYNNQFRFLIALALGFGIYLIFMLILRMNVEEENERYLAPLYPLFFLIFFILIDNFIKNKKPIYKTICLIVLALWLVYPITRTLKNAQLWHTNQCKVSKKSN